jgi:hypothetical protein
MRLPCKDPFFDRDLENFKRLHADGVISIGAIVTRGESLQGALRAIVAQFARKHGISNKSALSAYYSPTSRQITIIERNAIERAVDAAIRAAVSVSVYKTSRRN